MVILWLLDFYGTLNLFLISDTGSEEEVLNTSQVLHNNIVCSLCNLGSHAH